jgi:hypothetical protein
MRLPISCTTSPTITSSSGLVVPSVVGSALGVSRMGNGYETAAGDSVRVWGTIQWTSTLEGSVTLTIPLPFKAAANPLSVFHFGTKVLGCVLNAGGTAIEATFTATADAGAAYIAVDFQTATANT